MVGIDNPPLWQLGPTSAAVFPSWVPGRRVGINLKRATPCLAEGETDAGKEATSAAIGNVGAVRPIGPCSSY